jgi:hypothetical protein
MRIERGIRHKKGGFEAYVRVDGRQVSKWFPSDTPIKSIRKWRDGEGHNIKQPFMLPTIPPPPVLAEGGYVYFIQCREFIKVGKARNVAQRLEELQTAHPEPLRLLAFIPCSQPSRVEAVILREYRPSLARGEWLKLTADVRRLVTHHAGRCAGTINGTSENTA